jgi:hypothetical protein
VTVGVTVLVEVTVGVGVGVGSKIVWLIFKPPTLFNNIIFQ